MVIIKRHQQLGGLLPKRNQERNKEAKNNRKRPTINFDSAEMKRLLFEETIIYMSHIIQLDEK